MELEYKLMDRCVGSSSYPRQKISICACAMEKTQENGFLPDYDNDDDYFEDKQDFLENLKKNINSCYK
jgi:hypothetical protein